MSKGEGVQLEEWGAGGDGAGKGLEPESTLSGQLQPERLQRQEGDQFPRVRRPWASDGATPPR